jgi:hypothetical protein
MQKVQSLLDEQEKGLLISLLRLRNLDDYVSVFGLPVPGGAGLKEIFGEMVTLSGPTYASYAAQAWLASENSPITVVRLAGDQHLKRYICWLCWLASWKPQGITQTRFKQMLLPTVFFILR